MSHTMVVYFLSVIVMWVPATFSMRRVAKGHLVEELLGGLMVALVWPLSIPALSLSKLHRVRAH